MKYQREKESLKVKYSKFVHRKNIAAKQADPFQIRVNGNEFHPIFVDIRDNLLITGQVLSAAPAYGIDLTKQLLTKKHIIHAKTTYEGADTIWFFLHTFGFSTDGTAQRHIDRANHKKNSPRFSFHLFDEKHHVVEDSFSGGRLISAPDIDRETPIDVVFYLKQYADPSVDEILRADRPLDDKINDIRDLPGAIITKLMHKGRSDKSDIPSPASLPAGYNHIVISYNSSETAFEYKNRLHLRDVFEAGEVYFKERVYEFGWNLQQRPLGNWVIVTPGNEPVLQRTNTERSKYYYTWNPNDYK